MFRTIHATVFLLALLPLGCAASRAPVRVLPPTEVHGVWHRLQPGETLAQIATRHRVPLIDLEELNGVDRRQALKAGRQLFIPKTRPKRATRRRARATRPPARTSKPGRANTRGARPPKKGTLAWPVGGGKLSSRFGRRGRRVHEGIDIAAPEGTPVLAVADGRVIYSGSGIRGYGKMLIIRHPGELVTVYAHNRRNLVGRGDRVKRGQQIAEVGHTGRTSGNHLHFELRRGEVPINPLPSLQLPR